MRQLDDEQSIIQKQIRKEVSEFLKNTKWAKYNPNGIYVLSSLIREVFEFAHARFKVSYRSKDEIDSTFYHFVLSVLLDTMTDVMHDGTDKTKH